MNRPLFIIIGSVVILILILIWVYVLFIKDNFTNTNNTGNSGTFSNLDLEDTSLDPNSTDSSQDNDELLSSTTDTGERKKLRQLTTKRVVGFSEINASTSDVAYFIEAGVGHMYEVDIFTGQERRISATTFPDTYSGEMSTDGKFFVLQTGYTANRETHVGSIDVSALAAVSAHKLEKGVVSYDLLEENKLVYAINNSNNLTVRSYDLESESSKELFTVPFQEAQILWGDAEAGPHFFFPKPASGLEGFLYEYRDGTIRRLPLDGFNFSAYASHNLSLGTFEKSSKYQSALFSKDTDATVSLVKPLVPQKCLLTRDSSIICGIDVSENIDGVTFQNWLQGAARFADDIYSINIEDGERVELANTLSITGRTIDVMQMEQGTKHPFVYFINKNDQTLWIYEHEPTIEDNDLEDDNE